MNEDKGQSLVAIGLKSRITATLAGVITLFGLFVLGIVYELMGRTLRRLLTVIPPIEQSGKQ